MNCVAGLFVLILGAVPYMTWQQTYDGGNTDKGHGICLDSADHVVIVGESNSTGDFNAWIVAIDKSGDSIWSVPYDDGGNEWGVDITTAKEGGVAIAANTEGAIKTILYNPYGEFLWERVNSRSDIAATTINASNNGNIYTVGKFSTSLVNHFLTIDGYNYSGQQLIDVDEGAAINSIGGIQIDVVGDIYLGADQEGPCVLWKFSSQGDYEWWKEYENGTTKGFGLEMNDAPHLFQSGDVATTGSNWDFLLLKWDTTGALIWPEHKAFDLGHNEYCRDIKLDAISDCYLAGWQVRGAEKDAALVKTDSAGRMLWSWVYEMEGDQEIEGIEVDDAGYVYLAGSHHNGVNWDMLVMQVRQPLIITGRVTDSVGSSMENIRVVLTGDTTVEVRTDTGGYYGIEVYNGGDYTVSPDLPGWMFLPPAYTYSPLAHREFNQNFSGEWTGVEEDDVPIDFNLQVMETRILYSVPYLTKVKIAVYDVSGRMVYEVVDGEVEPGKHCLDWKGCDHASRSIASGIYFIKMTAARTDNDDYKKTTKIVVLD